jgi:hypothetical protein
MAMSKKAERVQLFQYCMFGDRNATVRRRDDGMLDVYFENRPQKRFTEEEYVELINLSFNGYLSVTYPVKGKPYHAVVCGEHVKAKRLEAIVNKISKVMYKHGCLHECALRDLAENNMIGTIREILDDIG